MGTFYVNLVGMALTPRRYEIERQIHGVKAKYNDIQMYDHQQMLPFFAGKKIVSSARWSKERANTTRHRRSRTRRTRYTRPRNWTRC